MTQERETYEIMKQVCPCRSSELALECLKSGIGVASSLRYARWFCGRGFVINFKAKIGDAEITYKVIGDYMTEAEYRKGISQDDLFPTDRYSYDR